MAIYALKPFIGDVIVNDGNQKKTVTKKFAPGNIVKGGKEEDNTIRKSKGLIGSKEEFEAIYGKDGERLKIVMTQPDKKSAKA